MVQSYDLGKVEWSGQAAEKQSQESQKRDVDIRKGDVGADVAEATRDAMIRKAKADAAKAEADAAKAEAEAKEGPAKSATEIALESKKSSAQQRAAVVRAAMLKNIRLYKSDIKGQPASRLFGYAERFDKPSLYDIVPAIPAFENFTAANATMLALIRPLVAQSAKEGDSDKEMAVFLSYIPEAGDSDRTIETKYEMLDTLISGLGEGKLPSELLQLNIKPRGIDDIEADLLKQVDPTKTRGYRLPEETEGRIRALYNSGELTPEKYADLVVTGAIKANVQPDEAFKQDALAKGRETVQNMEKGLGWGGFDYGETDEAARAGLSWPEAALSGVANLPMSAVKSFAETGKALTVDLPETVTSIGKLAGDALGITDGETLAALGEHYATQYGTEQGFLTALAERPFEVLSDATVVTGALGKVGNFSKAAKLSEALDPVRLTERIVSAPFKAVVGGTKLAGEGATQFFGATTGAGADALKEAVKAGREGGEGANVFLSNMRGEGDTSSVLTQVRQTLDGMRTSASEAYRSGMLDVTKDKTILDFDPIYKRLDKLRERAYLGDKVKNPSAAAVYEKAKGIVDDWKSGDPDQFHTPEGMDALKQRLGDMSNDFKTENNRRAASIASGVYGEVKDVIAKQVPAYSKVMSDYSDAMDVLKGIETELSLKPDARIDTSLRKLQSIMRNNANTNYGRRVELGRTLEAEGATELFPSLAGQQLSAKTPRGLGQVTVGAGLVGAIPTSGASLAMLPLTSPRLMGEAAFKQGEILGKFDRSIGEAATNARQAAQPAVNVYDYLRQKYDDYRLPIQSLMAGAQGLQATQEEPLAPAQRLPEVYGEPNIPVTGSGPAVELGVGDMVGPSNQAPAGATQTPLDLGEEGRYDPQTDTFILPDGSRVDPYGNPIEMARGGLAKMKRGGSSTRDRARSFAKGATFAFNDEIEAGLRALAQLNPAAYRREVNRIRAQQQAYENANPIESLALEGAGSIVPAFIPGGQIATAGRLGSLAAKAPMAVRRAAPIVRDAALYGAGSADSIRDIPRAMGEEAAVGLGLYGAGRLGGRLAARPAKAGYRKVRSIFR